MSSVAVTHQSAPFSLSVNNTMDCSHSTYPSSCGKTFTPLTFTQLQSALLQDAQLSGLPLAPMEVMLEVDAFESQMHELLKSQMDLQQEVEALSGEVARAKDYSQHSRIISAKEVLRALFGPKVDFCYQLKATSMLPKTLYRYKPYRLVMEMSAASPQAEAKAPSPSFSISAYSSRLPVRRLEGSVVAFDKVSVTKTPHHYLIEIVNLQFLLTTKSCDFRNLCLVICHTTELVRPLILEGLCIRARKRTYKSQ